MKKNDSLSRLFFVFAAYFVLAILIGATAAFFSQVCSSIVSYLAGLIFSDGKTLFALRRFLVPTTGFAVACAVIACMQYILTQYMQVILKDKVMTFAAMCVASVFCCSSFSRYSSLSYYVIFNMRWLPCEICSFMAGAAALFLNNKSNTAIKSAVPKEAQ